MRLGGDASRAEHADLVELITTRARAVGADAVLTFSEYAVVAVAEACRRLGLRVPGRPPLSPATSG